MREKFHLVYKTAATPFFPICLMASCYGGGFKKLLGTKLKSFPMIAVIDGDVVSWFFDNNLRQSSKIIFNRLLKNHFLIEFQK